VVVNYKHTPEFADAAVARIEAVGTALAIAADISSRTGIRPW
jgi:hypothetical protein